MLGKASVPEQLHCFTYTTLLPTGVLMLGFHALMMMTRVSGCTMGTVNKIAACIIAQCVWLLIWLAWYWEARKFHESAKSTKPEYSKISEARTLERQEKHGEDDDEDSDDDGEETSSAKSLNAALNLSLCAAGIILGSMFLRLGFLLESHGDFNWFNEAYTGGDWTQACPAS